MFIDKDMKESESRYTSNADLHRSMVMGDVIGPDNPNDGAEAQPVIPDPRSERWKEPNGDNPST